MLTRSFFGGFEAIHLASANYATFIIGGALAHKFVIKEVFHGLTFKHFIIIMCWKFIFSTVMGLLFMIVGIFDFKMGSFILAKRITSTFTVSAFIVGAILLLFRQARESFWQLFYDSVSGLPNHRSLQRYFEELVETKQQGVSRALMLIQLVNFKQLVQSYGYEWLDIFFKDLTAELQSISNRPHNKSMNIKNFSFSENSIAVILEGISKSKIQEKA